MTHWASTSSGRTPTPAATAAAGNSTPTTLAASRTPCAAGARRSNCCSISCRSVSGTPTTVTGAVPSRGWSHPQLLPYTYVQAPPDGIYDYDFVAAPPRDVVAQVLTRLTVTAKGLPPGAKGIRVHASLNSKEALISPNDSAGTEASTAMGEGMLSAV